MECLLHVWRMCTGLFKGLQNVLVLKYLHKSSTRNSLLCPSHSGCAVSRIYTPTKEARTNGQFGWVCSGTELKKNSDRQNNPDLDNKDKTSSIQQSGLQLHLPNPQLMRFFCLCRVCTHLILEQVNHSWLLKRFQARG